MATDVVSLIDEAIANTAVLTQHSDKTVAAVERLEQTVNNLRTELDRTVAECETTLARFAEALASTETDIGAEFKKLAQEIDLRTKRTRETETHFRERINNLIEVSTRHAEATEAALARTSAQATAAREGLERFAATTTASIALVEAGTTASEKLVAEFESAVEQMLTGIDANRTKIVEQHASIEKDLRQHVQTLEETVKTVSSATADALADSSRTLQQASTTTTAGLEVALGQNLINELRQRASDLAHVIDGLTALTDAPRAAVESDLPSMTRKLNSCIEPLLSINAVVAKARANDLLH